MITMLSGGTGSSKLLRGLLRLGGGELTVVANIGDNTWWHGLYICPDLDTIVYSAAGLGDEQRGWGVAGDTFHMLHQLGRLGESTWFKVGDRDLALHVLRTEALSSGLTLTEFTKALCARLGLGITVLPACDEHVETKVMTEKGEVPFQDFWVKGGGRDEVYGVRYCGASTAKPAPGVLDCIYSSKTILIAPANPVTSIGPILAIPGIRSALRNTQAKIIAVSPIIMGAPFSGPAGGLMRGVGLEVSPLGVAKFYSEFLNAEVIDPTDEAEFSARIEQLGVKAFVFPISMRTHQEQEKLASFVLQYSGEE